MDREEELRRRRGEHTRSYSQDKPIGSGDNAKSIVRGVKQWLPDIPGAVGDLADMLYAGGANVLQGQKRRSIAPLGAGPAIRRAIAKKSPLEQAEMRATPETDWVEEGVRFANPAMFMSPKNIAQLGGLALAGGAPGAALSIIKPKGGNWYTVKDTQLSTVLGNLKRRGRGVGTEDLNRWLEGPLAKYIKNDLATENDTIRRLLNSENPVSHLNTGELLNRAADSRTSTAAALHRRVAGPEGRMPDLPLADTARAWNDLADASVVPMPAGKMYERFKAINEKHPMAADWVKNLPPDSPIYMPSVDFGYTLGLDHLADELWNAVRKNSDLPENLRLKPEDFQQMGIEKAVRHVADINNWRANAKAAASQSMLGGPGVKLLREYPENNPKGLRWVELNDDYTSYKDMDEDAAMEAAAGAVQKQLKYEGDTMGHCVGGYCDDVLGGTARIFSLRDAKGEPHVTIEVAPTDIGDVIQQIKGKQNLPPKDEYLPFVRDFLSNPYHGSSWQDAIGDLNSLGLSPEDIEKIPRAYARGGLVGRQEFNGAVGYILD